MNYNIYTENVIDTKYTFFTGKGGVGKTSIACASAINLAKKGKKVLLISTDPASNLQDVFGIELSSTAKQSRDYDNLYLINLDPEQAAEEYRKSTIEPYVGLLPEEALENMTEQLSGSCTTEIAAFNEFTDILTDKSISDNYDSIIFDTAPTGHTLRMLQLPSAWNSFIEESTHGASCLGQLSGLEDDKEKYSHSVDILCNPEETKLVLVSRPETTPILEAERASKELFDIGIKKQTLVINGILEDDSEDIIAEAIVQKQKQALNGMSEYLKSMDLFKVNLKPTSIHHSKSLEQLFNDIDKEFVETENQMDSNNTLLNLVDDIESNNKKIVFTMGKGGVGKTTIASAIALELSKRGNKVTLTTTDPANHLKYVIKNHDNLTIEEIDEDTVLQKYKDEVISEAKKSISDADLDYIEEDLRSPCTQEIATFKAFAEIVDKSDNEIVIIDTAPTGHTLLLLDSTESYHKELERSSSDTQNAISKLLPKILDEKHTEVVIVTLPEATPYYEADRLEKDLKRANIFSKWWVVNSSIVNYNELKSKFLISKRNNEINWINTIHENENRSVAVVNWITEEMNEIELKGLLKNGK